jgi:hypothetical protein
LAEADSALDAKEEERINTEIVDCVFQARKQTSLLFFVLKSEWVGFCGAWCYSRFLQCFFRLLKANPPTLPVLPVVLRGISKYAHLIR